MCPRDCQHSKQQRHPAKRQRAWDWAMAQHPGAAWWGGVPAGCLTNRPLQEDVRQKPQTSFGILSLFPLQPPKNKGKSKKPAKARSPVLINGLTKDELSKEQMEEHAAQLREELEREREERNYFQLERDKMFGFMETTQRKLEDLKAELKIVNKEIEEDERRHQAEIKVYKQKVKHVLCEHQNVISGLRADAVVLAEAMQKEQQQLEAEIHLEQEAIAVDMQDVESEQLAWEIELQKHNEELSKVKDSGEKQCAEVIAKYERKMQLIPQDMENIRKTQMSERRQHWDDQMASLIEDHDRAVRDWDVVIAHIKQDADLNLSLKAQIKDMKTKRCLKDAEVARVLPDNRRISEALLKLEKKITENEKKGGTQGSRNTLEDRTKNLEDLKSENEALEMKVREVKQFLCGSMSANCSLFMCICVPVYVNLEQLEQQRDELHKKGNQKYQEMQHDGDERIVLLERKEKTLTARLEKIEAQIISVSSASNMDPAVLDGLLNDIEEKLDNRNNTIKMLQMQKATISKAWKDLPTSVSKLRP
ncbi:Growth arrest-specific protein 8 [Takifugu flavidus]|uniref:Dynein regulatory complex subunit 4 n=1 Tax=Takifugu flavidus TaxID=433684 RepID=A0A5C6NM44_9TELE|nr:Growth arrest-specific protein 8 [Takifugu flavidus]